MRVADSKDHIMVGSSASHNVERAGATGGELIMNSTDRVANLLIGSRGDTYCDDCITESLTIDGRQQVQRITSALDRSLVISLGVQSLFRMWP
jgi:hypothetical protein